MWASVRCLHSNRWALVDNGYHLDYHQSRFQYAALFIRAEVIMYICICNQVTDGQVRATIKEKRMSRVQEVCRELGICNQCGKCANEVRRLVADCQEPVVVKMPRVRTPVDRTGYASRAVGNC